MRTKFIAIALSTVVLAASAYADAVFQQGNNPAGRPWGVIAIGTQLPGFSGFITGEVRGTNVGDVSVIASSTRDTLMGGSNGVFSGGGPLGCGPGQGSPCLHQVALTWPGFGFPFIVINPARPVNQNGNDLIVTVSLCTQIRTPTGVACVERTEQTYPPPSTLYGTSNNQNFLTINAVNNETITGVNIESSGGFYTIDDIRIGITNVGAGIPEGVIPEPSSMTLLGTGLLVFTQVLRRKLKHGFGTRSA